MVSVSAKKVKTNFSCLCTFNIHPYETILSSVADQDPQFKIFLGLLDPDPLGKDTDPDPFIIRSSLQRLSLNNVSAQLMQVSTVQSDILSNKHCEEVSKLLDLCTHGLNNYIDTKAKCRHLKKLTCKVNCYPSNLLSSSSLPSPLPPLQCVKGGIWVSVPQTDKHLPQSPFTGQFF